MLGNVSPIRPNPREDSGRLDRTRPQRPPRNDDFRKSMRDRPSKQEEEHEGVEEREESPPSLFDLSKSRPKPKSSSAGKSSLKESSSDFASNRPVTAKPERDQSQDQESESNLLASNEGAETTASESEFPQPADN